MTAGGRRRVQSLWVALESGGFGVDPSSDGSGYYAARIDSGFQVTNERAAFLIDEATGRNRPTDVEPGPDGASLQITFPAVGLAAAAGDGSAPNGQSVLTVLLSSTFGTAQSVSGEGISASANSTVSLDTNSLAAGQIVICQGASTNSGRAQSRRVTGSTSPYTIAPADWAANPDAADVAYGSYQWRDSTQGYSIAAVAVVETAAGTTRTETMLGGRVTALSYRHDAKGRGQWSATIRFDSRTEDATAKTSLPAIAVQSVAGITGLLSPVYVGSTAYPVKSVELSWDLGTVDDDSVAGVNGRAGIDIMRADLQVTITPRYAPTVWQADFAAGTAREVMIQFGAGVLANSVLNVMALSIPRAKIAEPPATQDDGGRNREQVVLRAIDNGASADLWRLAVG
jgi:hypothetical protein